ncbi:hypothetical protein CYLTODRAFT_453466 [Cylindrobasidium torrendii FP15055 ss-10]|uniref:Transmembrane protein n=1 Tax=Cylindrobasidium torrendii FP15055 ss-10 TaxID=1314674 RepID=A0A0D7BFU4_9AGAR|nr:hypothetical protein CYLTODRAFT_453466 [Cylindrobasidium torrendii FP15055 ss-10]
MADWQSPEEIQRDGMAFASFMHVLLGLYIWEWFTTLEFDWEHITRKRQFRWPLIFYFMNRYCLLFALIGIAIALNVKSPVNCQALYTYNQVLGNASIGLASINLSLRTMAVWSRNLYIVVPLVILILGHWSLLLHGVLLKAAWIPAQGCVITSTDNKILASTFIYGMAFDFSVLMLTAWKLVISTPNSIKSSRSMLVTLIFGDGLIYFVVAFLANLIATIFMLLNLNPVMSIIANVPAAIASTIVACRAVRRLAKFTESNTPDFLGTTVASTLAFRSGGHSMSASTSFPKRPKVAQTGACVVDGVHVQMDTYEMPDSYDAMGKPIVTDNLYDLDPEAQKIKDEFKRPY